MISENSIKEVKDRVDIYEVVSEHVKMKKVSGGYEGLCPFHKEGTPSFRIKSNEQFYKCFGCGKSGDAIKFLTDYKNISFLEAVKFLAEKYNITLEEDNPNKPKVRPVSNPLPLTINQYEFFARRGIETETVEHFKITNEFTWMPKAKANVNALCFNYFRDGELINVKYRGANKDFKMAKDAELIFYNLDAVKGRDYVVIVEGEMDCLSLHQVGVKSVVSVPNGASATGKLEYLDNCHQYFESAKDIVIMTDNDEPGIALRDELARRIGYDKCCKVNYPDGCKDANDILVKLGEKALQDCVTNAVEFPILGIISIDDMYSDVLNFYQNGYPKGIKVGINGFDDLLSFMPGQFTTITGIPGSGKSEFLDWLLTQAAKLHGWGIGVCSFENQPSSIHATKIIEKYAGRSFAHRENVYNRVNVTDFENGVNFLREHFYFINISQTDVTLKGILDKAKELVIRKGIRALVIDPWNYIEHKRSPGQTETDYVSECLTAIKAFCLTYGIHLFLVAHPVKLSKENGKYPVPTLYNISGSAHFFNKTDNGITVYRDFDNNIVSVYVQKVRYPWLGKLGNADFTYNIETRQYESAQPNF